MTKQQETDALDAFIESMPREGYVRDAIHHMRDAIIASMRDDMPLFATLEDSRRAAISDASDARREFDALRSLIEAGRANLISIREASESRENDARQAEDRLRRAERAVYNLREAFKLEVMTQL